MDLDLTASYVPPKVVLINLRKEKEEACLWKIGTKVFYWSMLGDIEKGNLEKT